MMSSTNITSTMGVTLMSELYDCNFFPIAIMRRLQKSYYLRPVRLMK
jgi:hypothetical protein